MNHLLSKLKTYGDISKEAEELLKSKIVASTRKRGDFLSEKGRSQPASLSWKKVP